MAQRFPYTPTTKALGQLITQMRRAFPATLDAGIIKKYGLAPNNESYLINVIRFLGLIDEDGARRSEHQGMFSIADDAKFASAFADVVRSAYKDLFDLHGDNAWRLDKNDLLTFFRQSDATSAVVGERQVGTFVALAELADKRGPEGRRQATNSPKKSSNTLQRTASDSTRRVPGSLGKPQQKGGNPPPGELAAQREFGVSVKVEIILPSNGDKATYDNIFRSIKENLMP